MSLKLATAIGVLSASNYALSAHAPGLPTLKRSLQQLESLLYTQTSSKAKKGKQNTKGKSEKVSKKAKKIKRSAKDKWAARDAEEDLRKPHTNRAKIFRN